MDDLSNGAAGARRLPWGGTAADPPPEVFETQDASVLLVEDDEYDREFLAAVLQKDFQVVEVEDAFQALERLEHREFDVVLADDGLPGMKGSLLLSECQERSPITSRVLLATVLHLETVLRSVNDGHIFACLQKPVDPNTLLTTVHNAARSCRMVRERSMLISELAEANAQIYDEQQRLLELNKELRMLVTIATHDLREPLRSTRFFLDKCIERLAYLTDPTLVQYLTRVRRAHVRMDELLAGLREWLHLQTADLPMSVTDVRVVVEEALDNLARLCTEREVKLSAPEAWPLVEASPPLLRSVFENLISNAIRFSPDGPPEIALAWRPDGEMLRFEVTDRGIGIDPAYHDQVFRMFRRLESRRKFEGTGSGLAISQKIIQRHGGDIGVESERGHGATFWFTLRASASDATVPEL